MKSRPIPLAVFIRMAVATRCARDLEKIVKPFISEDCAVTRKFL